MPRPWSVRCFEMVVLGLMVLGYLLRPRDPSAGAGDALLQAGFLALMVGWVLLITRRRSNLARWLYVAASLGGVLLSLALTVTGHVAPDARAWFLRLVYLGILALLFTPAARSWFAQSDSAPQQGAA